MNIFRLRAPISVAQPRRVRVGEEAYSTVKQVQIALISLGYDLGPSGADGKIGPSTNNAIVAFKKAHSLEPASTTITDDLMRELVAAVAAKSAPAPEPATKDTYHPPAPTYDAGAKTTKSTSTTTIVLVVLGVLAVGAGIYAVAT